MKIKKTKSLIFKLTLWYVVFLAIIIVVIGAVIFGSYRNGLMNETDETLREIADELDDTYWSHRRISLREAIERTENEFEYVDPQILIVKIDRRKDDFLEKVIHSGDSYNSNFILDQKIYCRADRSDLNPVYTIWVGEGSESSTLRVILFPIRDNYILQMGLSLKAVYSKTRRVLILIIFSGVLLLLFASAGGNFVIRKAIHPVVNVAQTANQITTDDLSHRIDVQKRKDEIGVLVKTFNDMISRLDRSVKEIKQFSGDVSHELRTPLTNIRGEIEVVLRKDRGKDEYRKALKSALEETYHMEKIIDDLLLLSRTESLKRENLKQKVQLDELLLSVYERYESPANKKDINVELKNIIPLTIKGQRALLERMFSNLIDNAVRYTKSRGKIEMSLYKEHQTGIFIISDTGIGIPQDSIPYIFDRFYVVEKSRSKERGGVGLGLSIIKRVADIHGASIKVRSKINKGTEFEVRFPLW